jgi:hypothetical protein
MKKISFKKLPHDVQNTIVRLQRPESDRFVFFGGLSPLYWLPVAGCAIWLFYLVFATQNYLWEEWMFWIFAGVTVAAVILGAYGLEKILATKFAKLKTGHIFTPNECLKISGESIESWNLEEIDALRYHEDLNELELWTGDREERIKTGQKLDAYRLTEAFDEWKANAGKGILDEYQKPAFSYTGAPKFAMLGIGAVICILLAGAISFGAKRMNVNYDDRQTWKRIDAIGTVEEYEGYKTRHPKGEFAAEADKKIGDILAKLTGDYKARAKKTADQNAVSAYSILLEEAARRPDRTIYVQYGETLDFDNAVLDKMKKEFEKSFEPYDYSFPKSAAEYRKNKMLIDLRQAFSSTSGGGAIKFELADTVPENAPWMKLTFSVKSDPVGLPYVRWSSWDGNKEHISYYPSGKIDFGFEMKGSTDASYYQTGQSAIPKAMNTGLFDPRDTQNYSFEKVYFSSHSEGFGKFIGQVFGLAD